MTTRKGTRKPKPAKTQDFDPLHVGNDDSAETSGGVAVYVTSPDQDGQRYAALLPRSLRGLGPDVTLLVSEIQHTVVAIQKAQDDLAQLVAEARAAGVSWPGIGWCVGTSGEAARQRWGSD